MQATGGLILATMPKSAGPTKPTKLSRADKKALRVQKRQSRRETWRNLLQAFTLTRQRDSRLVPYMALSGIGVAALIWLVVYLITGSFFIGIPFGVLLGALVAMIVFSRRAQRSIYTEAEGQPGAAAWVLTNQLRGDWRTTQSVAATTQLDAVHRLIGRPGVVLVGEGAPSRVRSLIAQEKKRVSRVAGETPIYDVVVGTGSDEVRLNKLNVYLNKLPRNLSKEQVAALDKRLQALGGGRPPLPQGPMPVNAKMRNLQRTVRRRS